MLHINMFLFLQKPSIIIIHKRSLDYIDKLRVAKNHTMLKLST